MYFYGFDPTFIILIPAIILSFYAQGKIRNTFSRYQRVRTSNNISGSQAARRILDANGLYEVFYDR